MQEYISGTRPISSLVFYLLVSAFFLISFLGLFIPIMEVDASQYASMSQELLNSKSWLQLTDLGQNYLDKPPLLFWLSSCSIFLFGNSSWAYKLPSFLLAWASVYFLFRLVKLYYPIGIAQLVVLLYAGSVGFLLFTNDIRTDTLLISFVLLAVWQLATYIENLKFQHLFIGSIALGAALLAKGPIGLVVPGLALIPHLFLKGKLKVLLQWKNSLAPLIILFVISPMLWGLYQQWGFHGIRFFFWEQSFGRITGENVWQNDASYFYFLHNIAWAFIPFTVFLIAALFSTLIHFKKQKEYLSFFGFILPFVALSLSHYKLPHYIYIVIPFAAILSAKYIHTWLNNAHKSDFLIACIQSMVIVALFLTGLLLLYFFEATTLYVLYVILLLLLSYLFFSRKAIKRFLFFASILVFLNCGLILNTFAYPNLLKYQSSSAAAFYIASHNEEKLPVYQLNIWWRAFHYYSGELVPEFSVNALEQENDIWVFTDQKGYEQLNENYQTLLVKKFSNFSVTRLSLQFLRPTTRDKTLTYTYLLKIQQTP